VIGEAIDIAVAKCLALMDGNGRFESSTVSIASAVRSTCAAVDSRESKDFRSGCEWFQHSTGINASNLICFSTGDSMRVVYE